MSLVEGQISVAASGATVAADLADGVEVFNWIATLAGFSERIRILLLALASVAHGRARVEQYDEGIAEILNCSVRSVRRLRTKYLEEARSLRTIQLVTIEEGEFNRSTNRHDPTAYTFHLSDTIERVVRDARGNPRWSELGREQQREQENPARDITAPKGAEGRTARSLDVEQARVLVEMAMLDPDDLIFAFALLTGLRPEEYLGLPRRHLDIVSQGRAGRGLVRVRQVAFKVRGGGWIFPPPKTGVRDVPFPAHVYHELKQHEQLVDSRRRLAGADWADFNLVFPSRHGTPQSGEWLLDGRFRPLLKRAGLPAHFTLYSLRYTYAALQFLAGERDLVVSEQMGHRRVDFTKEVYTKVLPVMRERASDGLERLLFGDVRTALAQSGSDLPM